MVDAAWAGTLPPQPGLYQQPPAPLTNPADLDSDEDGLALLPKHTRVCIIGNARTKISLVGQTATVKKATGLGGWHWLVLPSGEEIKLQRNALEVLERPTGNEADFSEEEEEQQQRQQQPSASTRGYPYEPAEPHGEDRPRARRPPALHHQQLEEAGIRPRPHSSRGASSQLRINLNKLQTAALKRYGTVYHLPEAERQASREQLLCAVSEHFAAQHVDEAEVVAAFLNAVKRHRMGLQQ